MPQMSPMMWVILLILMLSSYLILLNLMSTLPINCPKNKKVKNQKSYMEW